MIYLSYSTSIVVYPDPDTPIAPTTNVVFVSNNGIPPFPVKRPSNPPLPYPPKILPSVTYNP